MTETINILIRQQIFDFKGKDGNNIYFVKLYIWDSELNEIITVNIQEKHNISDKPHFCSYSKEYSHFNGNIKLKLNDFVVIGQVIDYDS